MPDDYDAVLEAIKFLDKEQALNAITVSKLDDNNKALLLTTKGLEVEEAKAAVATQTLAAAQTTTTKATSGLKLAMKGLWATLKSFIPLAIVSAVIGGIALAIDHFIVTAKEQKEKNDELKSSYEELSGELETIATRMDEIKDRIGELNAAGPLSITDKQELENLRLENEELERRKTLLDAEAKAKQDDINQGVEDWYEKEYSKSTFSHMDGYNAETQKYYDSYGVSYDNASATDEEVFRARIKYAKELLALGEKRTVQQNEQLKSIQEYAASEALILSDEFKGYKAQTEEEKLFKQRIDDMIADASFINDPAKHITEQFDKVWNAASDEAKKHLKDLSASGDLTLDSIGINLSIVNMEAEEREIIEGYNRVIAEIKNKNIDLNNTIYGNIDTNNRQVLEWTNDNILKYLDELNSWGYGYADVLGSTSTVMGTSAEFDRVEIAFSPILQTENGPVLLSESTVSQYIQDLISKATEDDGQWSNEELISLDATGLESDGRQIKGLIADIGETAIATGEAMHYVGEFGEVNLGIKEVEKVLEKYGLTVDDLSDKSIFDKESISGVELLNTLMKETTLSVEDIADQINSMNTGGFAFAETPDFMTMFKRLSTQSIEEYVGRINSGELTEANIDSYDELATILRTTGDSASTAYEKLQEFAEAYKFAHELTDELNNTRESILEIEKEFSNTGKISIDSLNSIAEKFPELKHLVTQYQQGWLSAEDVILGMKSVYASDVDAYKMAMVEKLATDESFYNLVVAKNSTLFSELAKAYGTDINNWKNLAEAKAAIDQTLIQELSDAWGQYYGVVIDSATGMASLTINDPANFVEGRDSYYYMSQAQAIIDKANNFKKQLEDAAKIEIDVVGFSKLSNSDGSGGGDSSSSDSSDKLDYIPRKIEAVQDAYSKLIAEADNAENTYANQLNYLNAAIDKQEELVALQREAEGIYKTEWEIASKGLSEEEKNLIMNGGLVIANYSGTKADQMTKADEAWSAYKEQTETRLEAEKTLDENIRSRYTKQREWDEQEIDRLIEKGDVEQTSYDKVLSYLDQAKAKSQGLEDDMRKYAGEAKTAWDEAKASIEAGDIAKIMNGELNLADFKDNKEYYAALLVAVGAYEDYQDAEEALNEAIEKNAETAKQAFEKAIEVVQAQQDLVNANISSTEKTMDLINAVGGNVHESMYKSMISENKEVIDLYEEQIALIEDRIDAVEPESAEYYQLQAQIQDCEQAIMDCKIQQAEWNESIKRLPINRLSTYIQMLQNIKQDLQNFIDEVGVLGITPSKEQYQNFIDMNQKEIDALVKQQTKLQGILGDYKYGSEKYTEVSNEIQDIENQISSLIQQQYEYNQSLLMIPIEDMAEQVDRLAATKTRLEQEIAEDNAKGLSTTIDQYKQLMSVTLQQLTMLTSQKAALTELLGVYDVNSDKYAEIQGQIDGIDSSISDLVQQQYAWNAEILNMPIENLEKINDNLSNYSSILDGVIGELDSALSGVNALIDGEIEGVQEVLDTLNKSNEARRVQLALEQAQYNLEKARNQKNIKVIRDGQLVYESDQDALRAANEEMSNAEYDKMVYNLEQQISYLETIKEKWQDVVDEIERANQIQDATKLFGDGSKWQEAILGGNDESLLAMFENLYSSTTSQKESIDEQIESNERLVQMMGEFVTRYQEGSLTYESALQGVNAMIKASENGFTALESLSGMMDLDNISALDQITSSTQEAISDAAGLFSQYLGIVEANKSATEAFETNWSEVAGAVDKTLSAFGEAIGSIDSYLSAFESNTDAINKNVSTWEQMKDNLEKQVAALEKAAAELEKWASTPQKKPSSSSSGGGSSSGSSGGGSYIWAGGKAHSESEGSVAEIIAKYGTDEEKERYEKYIGSRHTGIEKGFINTSGSGFENFIKSVAIDPLKSDEVLAKLQSGEGVFTQPQMGNLVNNSMLMGRMLEKTSGAIHTSGVGNQLIDCSIGEIHLHEVQDVDGFAKALDQSFASTMQQQMKKYNLQF